MIDGARLQFGVNALSTFPYRKGQYASRAWGHPFHFLMSYPSKLKPAIAHHLVKLFSSKGDVVLDPLSGVGTIPFEACSQGRIGLGSDLSPVAYHATRAKVDPPTVDQVKRQLEELARWIDENPARPDKEGVEEEILQYYHPKTLREILVAKRFFELNKDENVSFLLACMLHILHGNRPYSLSRRSHNIMPWPPRGPFVYKSVMKSLRAKVSRMLRCPLPLDFVRGSAYQEDVNNLTIPDESVDAIITSPPFHNNRDFLRMNRIRLWFCSWGYTKQKEMRAKFIENKKDLSAYRPIFAELKRVLKTQGVLVMHLGVVGGLNMAERLKVYAKSCGFDVVSIVCEDTSHLETHGIRDRGATKQHQFLVARKD